MRIGMMLRSLDERGGIGVYTRYITEELIRLGKHDTFILFYGNPNNLGRFAGYPNVSERVIKAPNKILWDQAAIPRACAQAKVDVLFHPKFTVPLLAPCKTVMVLHGAGWFMPEFQRFWKPMDLRYVRRMMPVYINKASAVLSVSNITTDTFNRTFHFRPGKIKTVYFAPGRHFRRVTDPQELERVRQKYDLPERFIFTVSGYDRGDRKNISGIFGAFQIHHGETDHHLVVAGRDCDRFKEDYRIPDDDFGKDIHFLGWVEQEDLPAIYSLADVFLYPSNVEAFPIPITEAMACGVPIITSDANGLKELVGHAALTVSPTDVPAIAAALTRVLTNSKLQKELGERSLERSKCFSWDRCARETLDILHRVVK